MNVLSIQSSVAFGHVGNAAAVPVLHRLGIGAWPIDTVQLSNHTDHATVRGGAVEPARAAEIVAGLAELGALEACDGLLTGYLGEPAMAEVAADALARLRAANPTALYLCDPVMGSAAKGLYVKPKTAEVIAERLLPRADIVMPNAFELARIMGRELADFDDALAAARMLHDGGMKTVVCTSLAGADGTIANLAVAAGDAWRVETPRLDCSANGAGDVLAALYLGHTLGGANTPTALSLAVSGVYAVLRASAAKGGRDLALIESLDAMAEPPEVFEAERLD